MKLSQAPVTVGSGPGRIGVDDVDERVVVVDQAGQRASEHCRRRGSCHSLLPSRNLRSVYTGS